MEWSHLGYPQILGVTPGLPGNFELRKIWLTLGLPYDYLQGRAGVGAKLYQERNAYKIGERYSLETACIYRLKVYSIKFISLLNDSHGTK